MSDVASLLRDWARAVPIAGDGPPPIDPETLYVLHERRRKQHPKPEMGAYEHLFSPEAGPEEGGFFPGKKALAAVAALVGTEVKSSPFKLILKLLKEGLDVVSHSAELLSPQPMMVRGVAAEVGGVQSSHTFRQPMPPYQAAVGLEAESPGFFGVTVTLEEGGEDVPMRATLWEGKRRRAVQSGQGAIHISGLAPGQYRLELLARGAPVGDIELVVEGEETGD